MKKVLIIIIVALTIFLIYTGFKDDKIYYFNIGDEIALGMTPYGNVDYGYYDFVKDYLKENNLLKETVHYAFKNTHTTDIINDIEANVFVSVGNTQKRIQNILIKADLVTVSLGNNDFLRNLTLNEEFTLNDLYNTFEETTDDLEYLFKIIRQYCKEKIFFIGFFNKTKDEELEQFFNYVNNKMINLTNEYKIKYINTHKLLNFKGFVDTYPTKTGYIEIGDDIVKKLEFSK